MEAMSSLDQVCKSIDARIAELRNEMAALEAARAALRGPTAVKPPKAASAKRVARPRRRRTVQAVTPQSDGHGHGGGGADPGVGAGANGSPATAAKAPAASGGPSPKRRTRARTRPAKSAKPVEALLAGKLEAMLSEEGDGLSAVTISKRSSAGYNRVLALLRELEAAGQVRRTGSRRTSLWRLITEEERIAERAAELRRLSTAKS
jgi:hypothetical protein